MVERNTIHLFILICIFDLNFVYSSINYNCIYIFLKFARYNRIH